MSVINEQKIFLVISDAELMTLLHSRIFAKSSEQVIKQIGGVTIIISPSGTVCHL